MSGMDDLRRRWHPVLHAGQRVAKMIPHNDRDGSRRNISAHYDLGNQLFSLFLDPTMMYSCAYFDSAERSLEEAQTAKLERVCRQLRLGPATTCWRSAPAGVPWRSTLRAITAAG